MNKYTKIFLIKLFLFIILISIFAIIYKFQLRKKAKYQWIDCFFISAMNQTFTSTLFYEDEIKYVLISQNIMSFLLIIGLITVFITV
jgi:hypothetical protein